MYRSDAKGLPKLFSKNSQLLELDCQILIKWFWSSYYLRPYNNCQICHTGTISRLKVRNLIEICNKLALQSISSLEYEAI